jgi:CubicO group peptidase (beta-lactamase class C family)
MRNCALSRLFFVALLGTGGVASLPGAVPTRGEEAIAAALQPFVDRRVLAGAVTLVASRERVLSHEAVGFADVVARKRMTPDALFWIASQSKPMTATALMMLVDEGKVSPEDPVERYLPEFKGQMRVVERDADHMLLRKPAHPITVHEILSHTSGLPFKSPLEEPTLDRLPLRDAVRSYAQMPLQFEPGTKFNYSNAGINTVGRLIEVVSGLPYETFMEERLFKPLGMKDTTFWPSPAQMRRLAKSYHLNAQQTELEEVPITQLHYPLTDRTRQPVPSGGLFSTAQDVAHFCQMVLNGGVWHGQRYLTEASVRRMTSIQTGDTLKEGYGYGWSMRGTSFGHSGAYLTSMNIDPQAGLIMVLMVQHAGFSGQDGVDIEKAFAQAARTLLPAP